MYSMFLPVASRDERRKISSLLFNWKSDRSDIEAAAATAAGRDAFKVRPTGVGCALSEETEDNIQCWVRALRAEGVPVSQQMIKAREAAKEDGLQDFAASHRWVEGFKKRHHISLRTRGTQGQKRPEDALALAKDFACCSGGSAPWSCPSVERR